MRIGLIGFGNIAHRHLANIRKLYPEAHISVCRLHATVSEIPEGANEVLFGIDALADRRPDVAFITGPANMHIDAGVAMAHCGADLFVEKPLSNCLHDIDRLASACREMQRVLMVGYPLRFNEPLQVLRQQVIDGAIGRVLYARAEVGQYLPDWRPNTDYREGVTARKELGGGVLLELSHEFDYMRWILGDFSSVSASVDRLGDLEIDVEDIAEVVLTGSRGELVSIHQDMLQRGGGRSCQIHGTEGSVVWNSRTQTVELYSAQQGSWSAIYEAGESDRSGMYKSEIQHFFECVATRAMPCVGFEDGQRALEIVEGARKSSEQARKLPL